LIYLC